MLSIGTGEQITYPRLIRDDNGRAHTETSGLQSHSYVSLDVQESKGELDFKALLSHYFRLESFKSNLVPKDNPAELRRLTKICSKLSPPVKNEEQAERQTRITSLPTYAIFSPKICDLTDEGPIRKDVHIAMVDSIDLQEFLPASERRGPVVYDLTDIIVHIGSGGHKQSASQRARGRDRAMRLAAAAGHYILYRKTGSCW